MGEFCMTQQRLWKYFNFLQKTYLQIPVQIYKISRLVSHCVTPPQKKKTNNSIANFTLRLHNRQNCRTKTKYLSFWKGQTSTDMMNEFCATFFFLSDLRQDLEVFGKLFEHFFITKHRRKKTFRDHKRIQRLLNVTKTSISSSVHIKLPR